MQHLFRVPSLRSIVLCACLTVPLLVACAGSPDAAVAAEAQRFEGEYQWSQGGDGAMTADFEPDGEDHWKVVFRFDWNNESHKWKGTADGSLEDGSTVSGTAKGVGGRRWTFEGSVEGGVMTAKHAELVDGDISNTGTFRIAR